MYRQMAAILVGVTAFASPASALLIKYQGLGHYKHPVKYYWDDVKKSNPAGEIRLLVDGGPLETLAYCVDLGNTVKTQWTATLEPVSVLGENADLVAFLFETYSRSVSSNVEAAALQVAIWESLYDDDGDLGSGRFRLTNPDAAVQEQAEIYLSTKLPPGYAPLPSTGVLVSVSQPRSQNLIVPEPATLTLLAAGGYVATQRRRTP